MMTEDNALHHPQGEIFNRKDKEERFGKTVLKEGMELSLSVLPNKLVFSSTCI